MTESEIEERKKLLSRIEELEKSLSDMSTGSAVVEKIHELSVARDRIRELEAENKQLTVRVNEFEKIYFLTKEESELMDKALFDSVKVLPTPPKDGK